MTEQILIDRKSFLFSVIGEPEVRSRNYLEYLEAKCFSTVSKHMDGEIQGVPKSDEDLKEAMKAKKLYFELDAILRRRR